MKLIPVINEVFGEHYTEKISKYIKCTLIDMSNKVLGHIARKYENVREGVVL